MMTTSHDPSSMRGRIAARSPGFFSSATEPMPQSPTDTKRRLGAQRGETVEAYRENVKGDESMPLAAKRALERVLDRQPAQREEEPPAFAALKELIPLFPETKQFLQKVRLSSDWKIRFRKLDFAHGLELGWSGWLGL